MKDQVKYTTAFQVEFIKNNPNMSPSEMAEMLGIKVTHVYTLKRREGINIKDNRPLMEEINKLTNQIEVIQMKANLALKNYEARQRKLKSELDKKWEEVRELKAIA